MFYRYIALLPKVEILRNPTRQGLIKSRMNGYRATKSPVVVFMDAHSETNEGWAEPLLNYLHLVFLFAHLYFLVTS